MRDNTSRRSRRTMKIRKAIILADQQFPHSIDLDPIYRYAADEKWDYYIELGDMLDMTALTGWTKTSPSAIDWDSIGGEIRVANKHLDIMSKAVGQADMRYSFGNHEERLLHFREKHQYDDYWRKNKSNIPYLSRDLKLKERGFKTYSQNSVHQIGKLHFYHGNDYGTNHCRNNVRNYGVNIVYGHVHAPERFTKVSPINSNPISAWSLGCLCTLNPKWKKGAPNKWANGFAVAYFLEGGNFQFYPIDIVKGTFVAPNGKLYR